MGGRDRYSVAGVTHARTSPTDALTDARVSIDATPPGATLVDAMPGAGQGVPGRSARRRRNRQIAMREESRMACTESRVLIDEAAERVISSDEACATHHEQVAKSRDTIAHTRALIRRLDER